MEGSSKEVGIQRMRAVIGSQSSSSSSSSSLYFFEAEYLSIKCIGRKIFALFVSTICPFVTISSRMKCARSRLNMISSSHTLLKYRSRVSTNACKNSSTANSFYGTHIHIDMQTDRPNI
jgi:hypothetical protein